jgi:hypothetical protein
MTNRKLRAKRSAKARKALGRTFDTAVARDDPRRQQTEDVTERLDAVYRAEPEDLAMDPLLTELQFRSLHDKW